MLYVNYGLVFSIKVLGDNYMLYSIQELFKLIDQHKSSDEFYSKFTGGFGINYYINRITRFNPEENRIICGFGEEIPLSGLDIEKSPS